MSNFRTSEKGRAFIIAQEGLELVAYRDTGGVWTIGVGDTKNVYPGLVITKAQAEERFAHRLEEDFEPAVNAAIGDALTTQSQFDAMVSLAYNIGVGPKVWRKGEQKGFRQSLVLQKHLEGDYEGAAVAFLNWTKDNGVELPPLRRRRLEESDIYMSELPGTASTPKPPIEQNVIELIKQVQKILGVTQDGDPGPITRAAVRRWKDEHNV